MVADEGLDPGPASVAVARHRVRAVLERRRPDLDPDLVDTVELLTSELVSNAVLHAGAATRLRVLDGDHVRVEVHDRLGARPRARTHGEDSVAGRGLELVEMLASSFGCVTLDEGKYTWFSVAEADPSPGRWDAEADPSGHAPPPARTATGRDIALLNVPAALYEVVVDYNEALLREYALIHLRNHPRDTSWAVRLSAADRVRTAVADAVRRALAANELTPHPTVTEGGEPREKGHPDITVPVYVDDVVALQDLLHLLQRAERLADRGLLLVASMPPEVRAVRYWWIGEVLTQWSGGTPTPWRLPDPDLAPEEAAESTPDVVPAMRLVRGPRLPMKVRLRYLTRTAVIADDQHTIVGASARARLLSGWVRPSPVGMRLSTLVPPRMRERHLAGYARHLLTGRGRILDEPMPFPVWHRLQHEVPNVLTLTKHTVRGRTYFIGWLTRPETRRDR